MNQRLIFVLLTLCVVTFVDGKKSFKSGRSSGAGRSTSRKTNYNPQPAPTSLSYPQASAPKPSLFGWQEKPSKNAQTPKQSKPPSTQTHSYPSNQAKPSSNQGHSYPSSQTGMSGNNQPKQPSTNQESIQRSSATQNMNSHQAAPQPGTNQAGHAYPASPGLSGSSGNNYPQQSGSGYPNQHSNYPNQGSGLSGTGTGAAPPPYPGNANKPYNGGAYPNNNNYGNNYQHPPPPPPYSNVGPSYGGYGGHGSNYGGYGGYGSHNPSPQMPGYFGNYGNNGVGKGFGGVGRTGNVLTGVGIAGAGVGTILTGLALWNLARSTGQHHHTVIYDNRGQPVAVAPANNTTPEADSILADLVNCTLSISNGNNTEVLAIPCAIATSFTPDADVKDLGKNNSPSDDTKCTVTVVNKEGREFMTTISCAVLLNTAAENNVTEPPLLDNVNMGMSNGTNGTIDGPPEIPPPSLDPKQPSALSLTGSDVQTNNNMTNSNCTMEPGEIRDPLNPCFAINHNITVAPLQPAE